MTPEEEKLDYWKPQLGDGILVGDTEFYWVSSDEDIKACPDCGGCTLNYAVDRYLDGAAVVIYRESVGSFQALQAENAGLREALEKAMVACTWFEEHVCIASPEFDLLVNSLLPSLRAEIAALNSKPESGG